MLLRHPPGVYFIKVGHKEQIIEIALSKLGARRKAHPTPLKSFSKVGRRARIGRKKFMKSTPSCKLKTFKQPFFSLFLNFCHDNNTQICFDFILCPFLTVEYVSFCSFVIARSVNIKDQTHFENCSFVSNIYENNFIAN